MNNKPTHSKDKLPSIPLSYPSLSIKDRESLINDFHAVLEAVSHSNTLVNDISSRLAYIVNKFRRKEISEFDLGFSISDIYHCLKDVSTHTSSAQALCHTLYQNSKLVP